MDLIHHLVSGFHVALTGQNLLCGLFGSILGTLIGFLPGLGLVAVIAILLPAIHTLDATPTLIMLAAVYCGAQYGVSTTAILIKVSGEASQVATATNGDPMARQRRAGAALSVSALGSFFAAGIGTLVIAAMAGPLTDLASRLDPAEYFSLMVLGLIGAAVLASGSLVKSLAMILLGLLLAQINTDLTSGTPRFTFGMPQLTDGIGFVVIAMGLFGLGGIVTRLGRPDPHREVFTQNAKGSWPDAADLKAAAPAVLRGTALGCVLGVLPGGGGLLASFAAFSLERRLAKDLDRYGKGAIEGLAGPESACNAGAQASFIPMLTLGIPPNAAMALMVGAMTIKGIPPGPQVMTSNPDLFWGLVASMGVGNLMLLILSLPLIGIRMKLPTLPYRFLYPAITALGCIGVYTLNNDSFDVFATAIFTGIGYVFYKLGCEPAPLLLGFILGPMMEEYLRRALLLGSGDWTTFATRPLSAGLLLTAFALIVVVTLPSIRAMRQEIFRGA